MWLNSMQNACTSMNRSCKTKEARDRAGVALQMALWVVFLREMHRNKPETAPHKACRWAEREGRSSG